MCAFSVQAEVKAKVALSGDEAESVEVPVQLGDVLCADGSIEPAKKWAKSKKEPKGVVFYVDETGQHGWALVLRDKGNHTWGEEVDIEAIPNTNEALADFNGKGNTEAILAMGGSYPAVQAIETAEGWYLPSAG